MRCRLPVFNVNGMTPVKVLIIGNRRHISVPQCSGIVGRAQAEGIRVLAKAIQVRFIREMSPQPQILILND